MGLDANYNPRIDPEVAVTPSIAPKAAIEPEDIERAMTESQGRLIHAAPRLGISVSTLKNRIRKNPALLARWGKDAKILGVRITMAEQADIIAGRKGRKLTVGELIQESYDLLTVTADRILKRINELEERISRGDDAARNPDDKEKQKHAFHLNVKNEPIEETMLRKSLENLYVELRNYTDSVAKGAWIKAKTMILLKGQQGPDAPTKARAGFRPKADAQTRTEPPKS